MIREKVSKERRVVYGLKEESELLEIVEEAIK